MKRHIPQQKFIIKNESKDEMKNENKPSVSFDPPNSKNPLPISSMIDSTMLTINSPGI